MTAPAVAGGNVPAAHLVRIERNGDISRNQILDGLGISDEGRKAQWCAQLVTGGAHIGYVRSRDGSPAVAAVLGP